MVETARVTSNLLHRARPLMCTILTPVSRLCPLRKKKLVPAARFVDVAGSLRSSLSRLLQVPSAKKKCHSHAAGGQSGSRLGNWTGQAALLGQATSLHSRVVKCGRICTGEQEDFAEMGI